MILLSIISAYFILAIVYLTWPIHILLTLKNFNIKLNLILKVSIIIIPYAAPLLLLFNHKIFNIICFIIIMICLGIAMISIPINILCYIYRKS